ncbi:hypothetical protein EDC04DRAFT_2601305 [Pisolithus marmoratus]|nr:hypothetical protein EDC04DRAFT_2601305 [Pisolithus marmoratus]
MTIPRKMSQGTLSGRVIFKAGMDAAFLAQTLRVLILAWLLKLDFHPMENFMAGADREDVVFSGTVDVSSWSTSGAPIPKVLNAGICVHPVVGVWRRAPPDMYLRNAITEWPAACSRRFGLNEAATLEARIVMKTIARQKADCKKGVRVFLSRKLPSSCLNPTAAIHGPRPHCPDLVGAAAKKYYAPGRQASWSDKTSIHSSPRLSQQGTQLYIRVSESNRLQLVLGRLFFTIDISSLTSIPDQKSVNLGLTDGGGTKFPFLSQRPQESKPPKFLLH